MEELFGIIAKPTETPTGHKAFPLQLCFLLFGAIVFGRVPPECGGGLCPPHLGDTQTHNAGYIYVVYIGTTILQFIGL